MNSKDNILKTVGDDIITLIKESASLRSALRKCNEDAIKDMKSLLLGCLEILDAFNNAFDNIESRGIEMDKQTKIWFGYFKNIRKLAERNLRDAGVSPIEAPDGRAVPGTHTIIDTKPMAGYEDDIIVEELEKGYLWNGGVLRKSKVITVKN